MLSNRSPIPGTVLLVEDDPALLRMLETILLRGGYSPLAAPDALEALEQSRAFAGDIHLLLTDVNMPGMDGLTLAQQLLAERPRMRVLVMSSRPQSSTRLPFLPKPFLIDQFLDKVRHVLAGPPASPEDAIVEVVPSPYAPPAPPHRHRDGTGRHPRLHPRPHTAARPHTGRP